MATLGKILVTIFFVGVLVWVSFVNRAAAGFSLPPYLETIQLSVALIILGGIIFGFIWGAAIMWFNGAVTRDEVRRQRAEIKRLEQELSKKDSGI
jgi:uncharacterized integral membrane protein